MTSIKKMYLMIISIVGLIGLSLYSTYAMFNTTLELSNVSLGSNLNYEFEINSNQEFIISANSTLKFNAIVKNNMTDSISYGLYYKLISPNTLPSGVVIGEVTDGNLTTSGSLNSNSNKTVTIAIVNKSNVEIKVVLK